MTGTPLLSPTERLLAADEIAALPREELHPGVTYTILWRESGSLAGLMWVEAGAEIPEHVHERAAHHVWRVDGRARVDGRTTGWGSYWHVPAGAPHALEGLAPFGCQLFYLYLTD